MAVRTGFRNESHDASPSAPTVVITMPAYKAEATLARTVADIPAGVADRLILVDDASPDNTAEIARGLGLEVHVHTENRGYGANQKTCYTTALTHSADVVVMLHPDYQYEPRAVPLLIAPILAGDADMTFGSRYAGLGDPRAGGMPLHRHVGNRVTTMVENLLLGSRFTEMHSGMRAYTRRCLLSLPFLRYEDSFTFDSQLLIDAVTTGQRVVEVPVPTRYTEESSSIGTTASLTYVARSVGYCLWRVTTHGRKRRRSPIGRESRILRRRTVSGSPLEQALTALAGYALPRSRILALRPADAADPERLATLGWRAPVGAEAADVAILLDTPSVEGTSEGDFALLADRLSPDGMVGVVTDDVEGIRTALRAAGYQLVEWRPLRGRSSGSGVALARLLHGEVAA